LNGGKVDLSSDDAEAVDIIVDLFKQKFDERVKFGQIFVSCHKNATPVQVKKAQEKVATIEKELQKSPFVEIAGQYSESSSEENIVEDIKDNLSPIKAKVIFAMQVGAQTKESFRDDDGFYFVKLFGKFAKQEIRYDDVKQLIASCLESIQKNRILNSFIEEILQNKDIKLFVF
ncbi:MAG: peptidylprolyl isomerase, partial [Endomicrobium sp.]|nr:peptidylprolyl isomerase [Endomicrobium sp.]